LSFNLHANQNNAMHEEKSYFHNRCQWIESQTAKPQKEKEQKKRIRTPNNRKVKHIKGRKIPPMSESKYLLGLCRPSLFEGRREAEKPGKEKDKRQTKFDRKSTKAYWEKGPTEKLPSLRGMVGRVGKSIVGETQKWRVGDWRSGTVIPVAERPC